MRLLLLLSISAIVYSRKHHDSDETEESTATPGEQVMDRLAVNMAGAFVKSLFPEMDRDKNAAPTAAPAAPQQSEVRRAPTTLDGFSPQDYNAIPQTGNGAPPDPFSYQRQPPVGGYPSMAMQQPATSYSNLGGQSLAMPNIPSLLTGGGGTPEALNAVRNQQYLAQLAKHQAELNAYSAKQMEYLDQQRRYQQAMIDHQAGAALLMQKQQQDSINEQMKSLKEQAYNVQGEDGFDKDNTVGGRVLTAARTHGVKTKSMMPKPRLTDDDVVTNDEHLKQYFKDQYGIDLDENSAGKLTEDERETLRF